MFPRVLFQCIVSSFLSLSCLCAQIEGWQQISTTHAPGQRYFGAMAYDVARNVVVLFGGSGSNGLLDDTWLYDGVDWLQQSPTTIPPKRDQHCMAYDPVRQRVLMYGGRTYLNQLDDTWEWTGTDWVLLGNGTNPHPNGGMAFDPVRQQMLRFGGSPGPISETRAWNGSQWLLLNVGAPAPREAVAMTTDTLNNRVVMYGGYGPLGGYGNRFQDTWEWTGTAWSGITPANLPPYLSGHAMVFDSSRGWVLAIGGEIPQPPGPFSNRDLFSFDGSTWTLRTLGTRPPWGLRAPFAYDALRRRTVFFTSGQTWEYTSPPAATFAVFGQGCSGSAGVPKLSSNPGQLPWVGGPFTTQISNVPFQNAVGLLSASRTTWVGIPLPLDLGGIGMLGCTLYVSPDVLFALTANLGVATWTIPIPTDSSLLGAMAWQQAFIQDSGANPFGATTSNAAELRIGGR